MKGAGFGTNAVAVVDDNGLIETAVGDPGSCVFVDGTTGPCGQTTYADAETPGGAMDGVNTTFTLANTPLGSSLMLFLNGLYMTANLDYTLTGSSIQFVPGAIPQPGDTLIASYRVDTSAAGDIVGAHDAWRDHSYSGGSGDLQRGRASQQRDGALDQPRQVAALSRRLPG